MNKVIIYTAMSAIAGLCLSASAVRADFIVSMSAPVTSGGYSIYVARAFNDGTNGTGTKLIAQDVTITTPGTTTATALKVASADTDGDGVTDADITDSMLDTTLGGGNGFGSNYGTFMRIGEGGEGQFLVAFTSPAKYRSDPGQTGSPTQSVDAQFSNLHSLDVVGVQLGKTSGVGVPANTGSGAAFANIVVPTGTPFEISGQLGGDTGGPNPLDLVNTPRFSLSVAVPEPLMSSCLLLGLGIFGSFRRRAMSVSAAV